MTKIKLVFIITLNSWEPGAIFTKLLEENSKIFYNFKLDMRGYYTLRIGILFIFDVGNINL